MKNADQNSTFAREGGGQGSAEAGPDAATPRPWEHNGLLPKNYQGETFDSYGACAIWQVEKPICTTRFSVGRFKELSREEQDANARLIVRCVNSHDALVSALQQIAGAWPHNTTAQICDVSGINDGKDRAIKLEFAVDIARAALSAPAKAEAQ